MQMFRPEDCSLVSVKVPASNSLVDDAVLCELNNLNSLSTQVKYFRLNFNSSLHCLKNIIFRSFTSEMSGKKSVGGISWKDAPAFGYHAKYDF